MQVAVPEVVFSCSLATTMDAGQDQDVEAPRGVSRCLRRKRVNLNRLCSSLLRPQVCQFQYCGMQLRDGDSLEWHYEAHFAQELSKLDRVRVKKKPSDFPDRSLRRSVRKSAYEKIRFRREMRQALPLTRRRHSDGQQEQAALRCPVCDESVEESHLQSHVDSCLTVSSPQVGTHDTDEEVDQCFSSRDIQSNSCDPAKKTATPTGVSLSLSRP